ncbi:MAG: N-acetylmuramoyl-L-alanine amidase [Faecousia sp.]
MKKRTLWGLLYILTIAGVLAAAEWGSRTVTAMFENTAVARRHCIIIDAGHGGEDGGATSCKGRLESTYNLEISLRLNDLMHLLGYDTRMIRTTDTAVYTKGETIAQKKVSDLKERVRIVNETENALLLSIHQNNFSDSRYSGAQVFYAGTGGSEQLAKMLQDKLVTTLNPGSKRKSKKSDGVYLMEHIDCTGVLIECGFLSNAEEEAKLRSGAYQKKLCCVIAAAVSQYLSNT